MTISYVPNVPFATNNPSTDQPNMLINTNAISTIIGIDHNTFNLGAGDPGGYHTVIHFQDQGNTNPGKVAGFGQLFTKTVGSPTDQVLFYESGNGVVSQLTPANAVPGITLLASCNFSGQGTNGTCTINYSSGNVTVSRTSASVYAVTFSPALTTANVYISAIAQITASGLSGVVTTVVSNITTSGFTLQFTTTQGNLANPNQCMFTVWG